MDNDLRSFIDSFPMEINIPILTIKKILRQIIEGLIYINFQGILHRDLKPQNILTKTENSDSNAGNVKIKIADFGLARTYSIMNKQFTKNVSMNYYIITYILFL